MVDPLVPPRRSVRGRDRRRPHRLAEVDQYPLDRGDSRTSAFVGTAAVEIRRTDVGSGSTRARSASLPPARVAETDSSLA